MNTRHPAWMRVLAYLDAHGPASGLQVRTALNEMKRRTFYGAVRYLIQRGDVVQRANFRDMRQPFYVPVVRA